MTIKPTKEQVEKMEELSEKISPIKGGYSTKESKVSVMLHFLQILNDLDQYSSFHTDLKSEVNAYKTFDHEKNFSRITSVMAQAIDYYKSKI